MLFSSGERKVKLAGGEAYFEIKPDGAGRPFVVDTGAATVQVLGTAFNVRRNKQQVAITVADGRVKVMRAGNLLQSFLEFSGLRDAQAAEAGSDQQVVVAAGAEQLQATAANARRATAWRQGRLEFSDEPLDRVLENVSRYSPVPIAVADPRLRDITYTGVFVPGQVDSWLAALEQVFSLQVRRQPDLISLRQRHSAP
jgi:transmembrane sensor